MATHQEPMSTFAVLPFELHREILQKMKRSDLFPLITVSRSFQHEAERLIWNEISISSPLRFDSFCSHLLSNGGSRLAICIHRFHIFYAASSNMYRAALAPSLARCFELMVNLDKFSIWSYTPIGVLPSCGTLFDNVTFQLTILICDFACDHHFASFLEKQPLISVLSSTYQSPSYNQSRNHPFSSFCLSPDALPELAWLTVREPSAAKVFIPDRPVSRLSHNDIFGMFKPLDDIEYLALSACPISILEVTMGFTRSALKALPRVVPNLEHLAFVDLTLMSVSPGLRLPPMHSVYCAFTSRQMNGYFFYPNSDLSIASDLT
jgi:hypothetical protein